MIFSIFKWFLGKKQITPPPTPIKPKTTILNAAKTPAGKGSTTDKLRPTTVSDEPVRTETKMLLENQGGRVIMPDEKQDRLGVILTKNNIISHEALQKALQIQSQTRPRKFLGEILIEERMITEENLVSALSRQFKVPYIKMDKYNVPKETLKLIPDWLAKKYLLVPFNKIGQLLTVAMVNPQDNDAMEELKKVTDCKIKVVLCKLSEIKNIIKNFYDSRPATASDTAAIATAEPPRQTTPDAAARSQSTISVAEIPFPKPPPQSVETRTYTPPPVPPPPPPTPTKEVIPGLPPIIPVETDKSIVSLGEEEFAVALKAITSKFPTLWEEKYQRNAISKAEPVPEEEFEFYKTISLC